MQKSRVFLSLGCNQGDKRRLLLEAISRLDNIADTRVLEVSSLYDTPAWGKTDQDNFYNLVLLLETNLKPLELLDEIQRIELELGRQRKVHWGPRTMDIDMLLYDDLQLDSKRLTIPHPYMTKRRFVLEPLAELDPKLRIYGRIVGDYLEELGNEELEKIGEIFKG